MSLSNYLVQRGARGTWQLRVPVPRPLQAVVGQRERIRSLKTTDRATAVRAALPILAEWQREWDSQQAHALPEVQKPIFHHTQPTIAELTQEAVSIGFDGILAELTKRRYQLAGADQKTFDAYIAEREETRRNFARQYVTGDRAFWETIADRVAARRGRMLDSGSDERANFVEVLAEAHMEALRFEEEALRGNPAPEPRSQIVREARKAAADAAPAGQTIPELFELYASQRLAEKRKRADTVNQDRKVIEQFAAFVGGKRGARSITRDDVRDWRNAVATLPPNWRKRADYRGLDVRRAAEKAKAAGELGINPITLNKYLSTVSPLFDWIVTNGYAEANPCDGMFYQLAKGANPRPPFTNDQLNTILASPLFTGFLRDGAEHAAGNMRASDWRYWIPLLCLFTGSRIGEAAQLHVRDVTEEHGDWFIHIRDDASTGQTTKSGKSRTLPVHRTLQRLGFLNFHRAQAERSRRDGNPQLFPELEPNDRGQIGAKPSRFWRDYLAAIGLKEGSDGIGAHSFRHTMADQLRLAGFRNEELGPLILGHSIKTVTSGYGRLPEGTARTLRTMMDAVTFPGVSFDHLEAS